VATVLIGGASGFIGSEVAKSFATDGHRVAQLARPQTRSHPHAVFWDPDNGSIDSTALSELRPDIVVNLAGARIDIRWTQRRKRRIYDSRIRSTELLASALARLERRPAVLVNASAIGYYGIDRGDEILTEQSPPGSDFFAKMAGDWEAATAPASQAGIRVVRLRTGIVMGKASGTINRLLLPFRLGLGARMGSGRQWMSWIALDDEVRAIRFLAEHPDVSGPVNVVGPEPVRNVAFTKAFAAALHRPAFLWLPAIALELAFGEMATHTILASQRVVPERLAGAGFEFRHPRLLQALEFELRR
jgi:hypothetical protein